MNQQKKLVAKNNATKIGGAILLSIAILPLLMDLDVYSDNAYAHSGTEITWVDFDEGMQLSKESGKKVIVDVYTDWCTWCKKMDSDVYTAPGVREQISKHFVAVKLNAESRETLQFAGSAMTKSQFARAIGVTGYPSTLFLNEGQQPITVVPGFIPADRFDVILRYIGEDHYKDIPFQTYLSQNSVNN